MSTGEQSVNKILQLLSAVYLKPGVCRGMASMMVSYYGMASYLLLAGPLESIMSNLLV